MKKILCLLCAILFCLPAAFAQSSVWKVSRGGNHLFIGGTIHVLRETDYPLPPEFDAAYEKSSVLVLEADTDSIKDELVKKILMWVMLPPPNTLQTVLNADTYSRLREACEKYGHPIENLENLKPAMAVYVLSAAQIHNLGFSAEGVDFHYLARAKTDGRPLLYLESVETQLDKMVNIADEHQNAFVDFSLRDMHKTETSLSEIIAEWRRGHRGAESLAEIKLEFPEIYRAMLASRNEAWLPLIDGYLSDQPVELVLVGLAHLQGDDGLLRRLETLGCKVKQIIAESP